MTKMSQPMTGPLLRAGLEESWTCKETKRAVAERQTPKGSESGKIFSDPPYLMAIPPRGSITTKGNHRPQVTPWATKEG